MVLAQEAPHPCAEVVVAIAGDHVAGAGDVEDFERRQVAAEVREAVLGDDIALEPAHEQRRRRDPARGLIQLLGEIRRLGTARRIEELRVPVPMQAAVGAPAQVLHQAAVVLRPRAMRVVGGDRVRGFGQRREAFRLRAHEREDLRAADRIDARHDVDQHDGLHRGPRLPAGGVQRGRAAHRGADQGRRLFEGCDDRAEIGGERGEAVVGVRRPVAVAVAARVEVDDVIARGEQRAHEAAPGMPRLAAAVQQDHRRRGRIAGDVGREPEAFGREVAANLRACCGRHRIRLRFEMRG
ncbi:MAG: hypothetical protein NVS9B10_01490 [Nevskia sp.]